MPRSLLSQALQWLRPKDDERNLISAAFHMITITLISMSLANLTWFNISGDFLFMDPFEISLGEFFWIGYMDGSGYDALSEYNFITPTIVNMIRTTILLSFMGIIFSLGGFFLDIIGPKSVLYRMVRRYAVPGTCTVLWIMSIVSVSYYIILLLEDSLEKLYPSKPATVWYGNGFYLLATAGGVTLVGIFYNLILARPLSGYYRDDDRCLIDGFDEGFDTFNSPTPPPPYNIPPPPYTP